jgi:putative transposase
MARLQRLLTANVPAHLWVRGNDRQAIFRSEGDRVFFHRCMVDSTRRFGVAVHAYVFMTNHVHVLGGAGEGVSFSRMMQCVGRRYVGYFNYLYGRTGTLWEGRFKSCPVETERYFLVCHQYVEMNPVRAGMVEDPGAFAWSSHRCNTLGLADDLVTPHSLYMQLGDADATRRLAYRSLFEVPLDAPTLAAIRYSAVKGWALGGEEFAGKLAELAGRPALPRKRGRPRRTEGRAEARAVRKAVGRAEPRARASEKPGARAEETAGAGAEVGEKSPET